MPDLDKLYEKADKYLQRQKFEAAVETYQEILRLQPDDEEALVTLGDLTLKLNRPAEALRYQSQLADFYIKRSDLMRAIAACKKVLKLSPQDVATLMKLAALYEKSQKNSEALETYREALAHFRKMGQSALMRDCLTRVTSLDPNNLEEHVELAELATQARQNKVAVPILLRAAQLARNSLDEGRWEKLVSQAHALDPANDVATIAAAELNLKRGDCSAAALLIEPIVVKRPDDLDVVELACRANLGTRDYAKAKPLCWKLYNARPDRIDLVLQLLEGMVQTGAVQQVLGAVDQLKDRLFQLGKRNEYVRFIERVYAADESNLEVLEVLSSAYNDMNQEDGLRRSLSRLFNLYLASENYRKAGDTLERILDVDPYGEAHYDRLVNLEGHIDEIWYKNILSRMQPPSTVRATPTAIAEAEAAEKTENMEDLVVEGEMYHQYQLSAKLAETLEKIDRLFPGADETSARVRDLYDAAGYTPKFKAPPKPAVATPGADPNSAGTTASQSLDDLRRISDITANIYRESTPQGVLQIAVNEVGRAMNASRCWGAVGLPDRQPILSAEYFSPMASPSDPIAALRVFAFLMGQAASSPDGWSFENASQATLLEPVSADVQKLGIRSLQALPLIDKDGATGLLILEQCDAPRAWSPGESLLLKAIGTQVVIAINNTKLRRLVRTMGGTDPETGLLPRSAYLECLLSEARRSREQAQPLSVCLLEPENAHALMKSLGDAGVQRFILQIGKALTPSLRQNDISVRYSPLSVVVIFPDTALPQAGLAVEKVRRTMAQVRVNGTEGSNFCAAVCDVPLGPSMDAVDGVTEVINRLEVSLDRARKEGGKRILISKFAG